MSHSFTKLWVHAIWSTKNRQPFITKKSEAEIYHYMRLQFLEIECPILSINGMPDHVHCLFLLNQKKSLAEIIKQIKGSTSHFINSQNLTNEKFSWQTGYAAFSVSESIVEKVSTYIKNQKIHHQKKSFQQEFDEFLKLHDL